MNTKYCALFGTLLLFYLCSVLAVTKTWNGPEGGKWYHPDNWDPPGVPTTDDNVIIPWGDVVDISNTSCRFDYMDNWGTLVADSGETCEFTHGGPLRNHHKIISFNNITFRGLELKNEIDAKIVCSKEVNFIVDIIENNGFIGFDSTEIDEWDSASPNFMRGTLRRILENAGEISWPDNIEIHSDSAINDLGATIESGKSISISADFFENSGDIVADENVAIYTKKRLYNSGGISISEFLEREYAGHMRFSCWNSSGDAQFTNEGEITGGSGGVGEQGDHVFVEADNFTNTGTVFSGAGGDGSTSGMFDAVAKVFINAGSMGSAGDSRGAEHSFDSPPGDINIVADEFNINMTTGQLIGRNISLTGRVLNFSVGTYGGVFSSNSLDVRTTNQVAAIADFSPTTTTDAFRSLGSIDIVSNNLVQPTVGIDEICDPDPSVFSGSASFTYGHIYANSVIATEATTESLLVTIRNSSSSVKTLRTVIASSLGWVTAFADTSSPLDPWECRTFYVEYTIPSGLVTTTIDTLTISLYMGNPSPSKIIKPTITYLPIEGGSVGIDELPLPERIALSAYPNPFNSAVRIVVDCHSRESGNPEAVALEIFDLNGRRVACLGPSTGSGHRSARQPDGTVGEALVASRNVDFGVGERKGTSPSPTTREFIWSPDETLGSGVYLVRARADTRSLSGAETPDGGAAAVRRVVYIK